MIHARSGALLLAIGSGIPLFGGCIDEVHDEAVQALGPEQAGVSPGPQHRPGQPCLTCHGGSGPASTHFSVGGTVYAIQGRPDPAISAVVQVEDSLGRVWTGTSNAAGNFYVAARDFSPQFPTQMTVLAGGADLSQAIQMNTASSRAGSCADCHKDPAGPRSPGPVYVSGAP